ncbi:MAG: 50S ribosomal protein L1 [Cuniculiplasma sp.]
MTLEDKIKQAIKDSKERKFTESLDISINLKGVDLSNPKNRINEEITLPKGRGREIKVALFGSEEMRGKVKDTADFVFGAEDLSKFAEDKKSFKKIVNQIDFFLAEANLMTTIGRSLGQVLGPRGKIPKAIPPSQDPTSTITYLKKTVRARSRDKRTFHIPVGNKTMSEKDIAENIREVMKRITSHLEKGYGNIDSIYVKTTMGKAVKLEGGDIQ